MGVPVHKGVHPEEEEEEELFVFNDTIEGPRAPSIADSVTSHSLWPSDDLPTPLRPPVDTGAGDRGGTSARFAVVAKTVGCREGVDSVVLR